MASGAVINVNNTSKKFCRLLRRSMQYGIQDIALNTLGLSSQSQKLRKGEFWAVDNVSFELKKGETLGIIGPNGAGKTTILKMLNGIFMPDKGTIEINGKVGALIEIGAGFHPMLTGRENIYVNGAILGMSKREIDKKFDSIVDFAEIGDFLDTPVKFYSSGMYVRLGFAIAIHCDPDILLVDEVLAVGDIDFQNKCLNKISEIKERTSNVIISHNLNTIRLVCDRCLFLLKGEQIKIGDVSQVLNLYPQYIFGHDQDERYKSEHLDFEILDGNQLPTSKLIVNKEYHLKFTLKQLLAREGLLVAFSFLNLTNNYTQRIEIKRFSHIKNKIDSFSFTISFKHISLPPGEYTIKLAISDGDFLKRIFYLDRTLVFSVEETESSKFLDYVITE
ncbi:MAG: ABC transporter ATP-binding protein [Candidatus Omnitrophota bacterium]|nr:MAG: ABC transporter ATP-binding protein [Candidatus Omnitrophota bacterium]